ncbi:MAG TPA: DUF402 domain-containing protein [Dehalococcoidia bacterium]|nr:DUF402 domain-containing protein [Dehalococcoidia bacterium]
MAEDTQRWSLGDVVVLRYVETPVSAGIVHAYMGNPALIAGIPFLVDGRIATVAARPYRVIADTDDFIALYQPEGTKLPRWLIDAKRYLPEPQQTRGASLRLLFPNRAYDVTLFFETDGDIPWFFDGLFEADGLREGWRERRRALTNDSLRKGKGGRFRGWYVNLQSPPRRTSYGFDIADLALDIVARPDRSWYWKDEDELAMGLAAGACTPAFAAWLRRTGDGVIKLIQEGASPFDDEWRHWRSPGGWTIETIPDGWQDPPALLKQWWEID